MSIENEIAQLHRLSVGDLRRRYGEVFGEATRCGNKVWLIKRIAWRLQSNAEGDLCERACRRAEELANDADLRMSPPRVKTADADVERQTRTVAMPPRRTDQRLPPPGSVITPDYKGVKHLVRVLADGFEHHGEVFRSLSAVAKAITGSHCNGYLFFHLATEGTEA